MPYSLNEATAILAGDALLNGAYEVLASAKELSEKQRLQLVQVLGRLLAARMVGQAIDINNVGKSMAVEQLEHSTL